MPRRSAKNSRHHHRRFAYLCLLLNTVCWGAALIVVKPALATTTPFRYLFYRFVIASILGFPILLYYWPRLNVKKRLMNILRITAIEIFGSVIILSILYIGLSKTTAIEASLISTTSPIFMVIVGMLFLHERQEKHEWWGLAIALFGTVCLTVLPMFDSARMTGFSLFGNLLIFLQNVLNAGYWALAKKYYQELPKLFVAAVSFYVSMIGTGLLSLAEVRFSLPEVARVVTTDLQAPAVWIAVLYMAVFGSIIGLTSYIKGQSMIETSEASLFGYLQPLVYLPLGILLLKEPFDWRQVASLAIIMVGVIIAEKRSWRLPRFA